MLLFSSALKHKNISQIYIHIYIKINYLDYLSRKKLHKTY